MSFKSYNPKEEKRITGYFPWWKKECSKKQYIEEIPVYMTRFSLVFILNYFVHVYVDEIDLNLLDVFVQSPFGCIALPLGWDWF